jgi:hypothetical protein
MKPGQCEIHELEYLMDGYSNSGEQLVLSILKEKGAPVNGCLILEPDLINYEWTRYKKKEIDVFEWRVREIFYDERI